MEKRMKYCYVERFIRMHVFTVINAEQFNYLSNRKSWEPTSFRMVHF